MSLTDEERSTLVRYEMEKARNTLCEVETLIENNLWNGAANRLYYAVFHAVSALLIHDGHQVSTHQGSHANITICHHEPFSGSHVGPGMLGLFFWGTER